MQPLEHTGRAQVPELASKTIRLGSIGRDGDLGFRPLLASPARVRQWRDDILQGVSRQTDIVSVVSGFNLRIGLRWKNKDRNVEIKKESETGSVTIELKRITSGNEGVRMVIGSERTQVEFDWGDNSKGRSALKTVKDCTPEDWESLIEEAIIALHLSKGVFVEPPQQDPKSELTSEIEDDEEINRVGEIMERLFEGRRTNATSIEDVFRRTYGDLSIEMESRLQALIDEHNKKIPPTKREKRIAKNVAEEHPENHRVLFTGKDEDNTGRSKRNRGRESKRR